MYLLLTINNDAMMVISNYTNARVCEKNCREFFFRLPLITRLSYT